MTDDKEYTRLCTECGDRGGENWVLEDPAVIVRAITEISDKGVVYRTENIEEREINVYGVEVEYQCLCGASFSSREWRNLEIVEVGL